MFENEIKNRQKIEDYPINKGLMFKLLMSN